jgi:hypothetical protein
MSEQQIQVQLQFQLASKSSSQKPNHISQNAVFSTLETSGEYSIN